MVTAALPFRGDVAARLVIPERITVTSISPRELDLGTGRVRPHAVAAVTPSPGTRPAAWPMRWEAEPAAAAYEQAVVEALARIRAGELEKVVLTRALAAPNPGIDLAMLLAELRRRDPECHLVRRPGG